jgi:hypothetical protein
MAPTLSVCALSLRKRTVLPEQRKEIKIGHDAYVQRAVERAEFMRKQAEDNKEYELRCVLGEKVFYSEDDTARMPGHIYSPEGKEEFTRLSHLCEFHFDEYTQEPEDDGDGPPEGD